MYSQMSPNRVVSNLPFTILAATRAVSLTSRAVMIGVLITLVADIISSIRGRPSVIFMEATPAKWKVFSVI